MSFAAILWKNRDELLKSFHFAAIRGILTTWQRCEHLNTTPQEPDFVAGLVIETAPFIYSTLHTILSPHKVSVSISAVFCHQKPEVIFGSHPTASCELGDILFAYVHTPNVGPTKRNAILFQAKSTSHYPYIIKSREKEQLRLYTDWPDFEYVRSTSLTGNKRFVTPKAPHSGAQYMLIDERPPLDPLTWLSSFPGTYHVGCCMPDKSLRSHSHLASELFSLFIFRTGRPFEDKVTAGKKQDWSQVVWDILEAGIKKSFNRKNSGRHRVPRAVNGTVDNLDGAFFTNASTGLSCITATEVLGREKALAFYAKDNDIPSGNSNRRFDTEEPESGVSIVLIETSERKSKD